MFDGYKMMNPRSKYIFIQGLPLITLGRRGMRSRGHWLGHDKSWKMENLLTHNKSPVYCPECVKNHPWSGDDKNIVQTWNWKPFRGFYNVQCYKTKIFVLKHKFMSLASCYLSRCKIVSGNNPFCLTHLVIFSTVLTVPWTWSVILQCS